MSVVVTTVNRMRLLKRALQSVEKQTCRDLEIIVLDDGSTDGTREFLSEWNGAVSLRNEFHHGAERARLRNRGAELARGEFLAFLDDDDEWEADKLESQLEAMREAPATAATYCLTTAIDGDGKTIAGLTSEHMKLYRRAARRGHSFEALLHTMLIFTSSLMVRRAAFHDVAGYDPRFVGAEDWHFYLKLARRHRIDAVERPLVRYRVHDTNTMTRPDAAKLGAMRLARVGAARDLIEKLERDNTTASRSRALLKRAIAMSEYWAGNNRAALSTAWSAMRTSPTAFLPSDAVTWIPRAVAKAVRPDSAT